MEQALYTRLSTYAPLTALISTRTYALIAPQGVAKPYCVYSRISTLSSYSHDGVDRTKRARMQVSCYAETYAGAKAVAAQVRAALEGWTAASISKAFHENELDLYEQDTKLFHVPVDFFVNYYE